MFAGLYTDPDTVLETTFDEGHDELILVKQIPMYSTCEHHLVPFFGKAHVAYIPNTDGRVTGLSKLARLVDGAPSVAVARHLWRLIDGISGEPPGGGTLAVNVFALPLVLVCPTGARASCCRTCPVHWQPNSSGLCSSPSSNWPLAH